MRKVITTAQRLHSSDHRLYILSEHDALLGIIKIGRKKLFLVDQQERLREFQPPCVLDFYIHESCQRQGFGKELFFHALRVC